MNKNAFIWVSFFVLLLAILNIGVQIIHGNSRMQGIDTCINTVDKKLYDSLKILKTNGTYSFRENKWYLETIDYAIYEKPTFETINRNYNYLGAAVLFLLFFNAFFLYRIIKRYGFKKSFNSFNIVSVLNCKLAIAAAIACFAFWCFTFYKWNRDTTDLYAIDGSLSICLFYLKFFFACKAYKISRGLTDQINLKYNAGLILVFDLILIGMGFLFLIVGPSFEIAHA